MELLNQISNKLTLILAAVQAQQNGTGLPAPVTAKLQAIDAQADSILQTFAPPATPTT